MIELSMTGPEQFDNEKQMFVINKPKNYRFEYSLKAVAAWEAQFQTPFLVAKGRTVAEMLALYQAMAIGDVPPKELFTQENMQALNNYIARVPSATVIKPRPNEVGREHAYQTSESIYAMMAMAGVPFECDMWNLNRLIMLLGVISERNKPQAKMSVSDTMAENRRLNAERRKAMNSKG